MLGTLCVRGGQKLCLPALFARKLIWYAYLRVITFLFAILGQTFRKPRSKSCYIASRVMWQECIPLCYVFVPIFEAIEVDVRSRKSMNKKSSKKGQKSEMPAGAARAVLAV